MNWKLVFNRVLITKFRPSLRSIITIESHAPTEISNVEEQEAFLKQLNEISMKHNLAPLDNTMLSSSITLFFGELIALLFNIHQYPHYVFAFQSCVLNFGMKKWRTDSKHFQCCFSSSKCDLSVFSRKGSSTKHFSENDIRLICLKIFGLE